jgi:hypothetical protein
MPRFIALIVAGALLLPGAAPAQSAATPEVWRDFAKQIQVGSELRVRLRNGQRFTAALVNAAEESILLQPKTRRPVDVQRVSYVEIASLERRKAGGGSVAKAVGIGAGVGAGAFLGLLLFAVAAMD